MMQLNDLHEDVDLKLEFEIVKPICRCCLSTNRRMSKAIMYDIMFKDLAGINVSESDGLPQWLCWECCALLRKAVRFKQKMLRAHTILYEYSNRCAPFPMDARDPELMKHASPQLSTSETLSFEMSMDDHLGYYEPVWHETLQPLSAMDMDGLSLKVDDVKDELVNFSDCDYDDDIALNEYKSKLTDDDIKQLLQSPANDLIEVKSKRKKKTKKKEAKVKKRKKRVEEPSDYEVKQPRSSIRKPIEIDPDKIKIINLNPEEQVRQREEESKSGVKFPFQCHLCFKGFNYDNKLENHMKKHSPSRGTYECKLCHMFLPTVYSYNVHLAIHTRRYECRDCGRRMTDRGSIIDHYRTQHEGQVTLYTCDVCGKVSSNNKTHRGHMRNHHSGDRPKCDQCGKSFVNKDALAEHMQIHQGVKNYECGTCGKRFRTRTQIKLHQMKHSDSRDYYCVECDVRFKTSYTLRQHLLKSLKHKDWENFKFACNVCEKRFETESKMRKHVIVQHEGVRAHRCPQCPAALASRASLLKHGRAVHGGRKPPPRHVCDTCGKAFRCPAALASRASLLKHGRAVHGGRKPPPRHVCDTCGKAFRGKSVLTNHVRTHTGEKPFSCSECGRSFTQRTAMRTHVRLVHLKQPRHTKVKPEAPAPEPKVLKHEPPSDAWRAPDLYYHLPV